ncbi:MULTISPECIES: CotH kinase family protein [unclassified Corallococcus]|uniref:CotH kinase family protein n=1 Tax=unclassified Corallococcus TaxID=2685029 RepID=UPI001A8D1E9D|nr:MULTISPECIES: CotH kinase family protein [unclassified Corallococcus]MBN9684589.1 CotH kinase family protein [Corallococcus sp. NCSPR001]WAS83939.1 CotH kinase family protein [Corallococcus sp. NCRR]
MRLRRLASLFLGLLVLAGAGCEPAPERRLNEAELPPPTGLHVTLDGHAPDTHRLFGTVASDAGPSRVEVYEDGRFLGHATLDSGRWSLPWWPGPRTLALEVVARDRLGSEARARVDFQHLTFDARPGLYQPETLLALPTARGLRTYFTRDGSTPTPESPRYFAPIALLARSTPPVRWSFVPTTVPAAAEGSRWVSPLEEPPQVAVVRYRQYKGTEPVGPVRTRSFVIGREPYSLPVLSLVTDAANFFDPVTGIYVPGLAAEARPDDPFAANYMQNGKEWERPVHVEWFETSGQRVFAQDAGVRIHGTGSAVLPQKSLRLYAKEDYGPKTFAGAVFPGSPVTEFTRLLVRTSGQDQGITKLRDCVLQGLLAETRLALQACRPTLVFLNGEYWGLHELRERMDEYYLASHYGVDRKKAVILEGSGILDVGEAGDEQPYQELIDYVATHDLAVPEHLAWVSARMDVADFIDYQAAQLYLGNTDWPQNNVKFWRLRTKKPEPDAPLGHDGRWRWLVYDLDLALVYGPDQDSLGRVLDEASEVGAWSTLLLRGLLQSPEFKARFVERFLWHTEHTFAAERVTAALDAAAEALELEMPGQVARWSQPASVEDWRVHLLNFRETLRQRPAFMRQLLEQYLGPQ